MKWQDLELFEEVDNRMVAHLKDMITNDDCKSILIRTVDTDVVVIMIAFLPCLIYHKSELQIMIDFGTGQHRRLISVNKSFESLGHSLSRALLFLHAFTGCDTTCSFYGKSKSHWSKQLKKYARQTEVIQAFEQLSWTPHKDLVSNNVKEIEKFVNYCYGQVNEESINEASYQIFSSLVSGKLRQIPPSRNSLILHIMRSAYQSGWIWGNTLSEMACPPVTDWGWTIHEDRSRIGIVWYEKESGSDVMTLAKLIKTCKCKRSATACRNCHCSKLDFACLRFCNCKQACSRSGQ